VKSRSSTTSAGSIACDQQPIAMLSRNSRPRTSLAAALATADGKSNEIRPAASLLTHLPELPDRAATASHDLSPSARRQATIALMIATAMQAFDATIANVALPQLERAMGGGIDLGAWVMTSYLCAAAVTTVMTGWLRRRHGARVTFIGAIMLFVVASLFCSVAASPAGLIGSRLLQGAAAGVIQPLAQAILLDIHPKSAHGRMLAIWGATIMAGPMLGPVLGGVITDLSSWRWIFAMNAPLGAVAMLGLLRLKARPEPVERPDIDRLGILLLVLGIGMLQLAIERSIGRLWPPRPETLAEAAVAVLALCCIAVQSRRSRFSLFRTEVFRDRNFAISAFYNFMVGAILFTTIVFLPALCQGPLGYDATDAGLIIAPRGLGTMATMLAVRWLIDRIDHRALLFTGLMLTAIALEAAAQVPPAAAGPWLATASAAQGIGVGLLFTPLSTLAFSTLGAELRTDAAGVYNLLRQLGCATGVAAMTAVWQVFFRAGLAALPGWAAGAAVAPQLLDGTRSASYAACFRLLAAVTALLIPGIFLFRVVRLDGTPEDPAPR
jgi:MFS transporter, DHA2 family, multidrug resistance protein